jgi:hypothetical protein
VVSPLALAVIGMAERLADAATDMTYAEPGPAHRATIRRYSRRLRALCRLVAALDRQEGQR